MSQHRLKSKAPKQPKPFSDNVMIETSNTDHPRRQHKLYACLNALDIHVTTTHHPPTPTAQDAVFLHQSLDGAHSKSLLLKNQHHRFFLVVMHDQPKLDIKWFGKQHHLGQLSFANIEDVRRLLQVEPGALTPLALLFDAKHEITLFLDDHMMRAKTIYVHPLINTATIHLTSQTLLRFVQHCGHCYHVVTLPLKPPA